MTERRARGTSPAGRGDRRTSRATRSRTTPLDAGRPAAAKRTTRRRPDTTAARPAKARRGAPRAEHTILGLSTGKAVILAAVLCGLALTLAVPTRTYFSQRAEAAQLAAQRQELEADLDALRNRRAQQQDPAFIRSEARDRLRLVMPGETPYIVQIPGIEEPAPPPMSTRAPAPDPWYTDMWRSISEPQPAKASPTTPGPPPAAPPPAPEGQR
ncbi:FtsB family cell division protein [Nocardia thailandica]|uniref:Septum formation initiator family protein n=1 Tax=Nocardia thailandica TaxID=257275 RepID=A0ABW6PST9_9NOCA|nr:septum formation initiator family protein [Nocardia thailandica]